MRMKMKKILIMSGLLAVALSSQASEKDTDTSEKAAVAEVPVTGGFILKDSTSLHGTDVQNSEGVKIAELRKFLVGKDGTISLVVLGTGGFVGVGERLVPVPWEALIFTTVESDGAEHNVVTMDTTENELNDAPDFTKEKMVRYSSYEGSEEIYSYWGIDRPLKDAMHKMMKAAESAKVHLGEAVDSINDGDGNDN